MSNHPFPMPTIPGTELMSPQELAAAQRVLLKPMSPSTLAAYEKEWDHFVQWAR